MNRRDFVRSAAAGAAAAAAPGLAQAQANYIRLLLSSSPGGTADALFRVMEEPLRAALGSPVIMEYKPGAGGITGHMEVSRGPRDGSLLGYAYSGPMSTIPILRPELGFDPRRDVMPAAMIMKTPVVFMANPKVPGNDMAAILEYAKSRPQGINCGNSGMGSAGHITAVYFASRTGMNTIHVPYKGNGPAVQALVGGEIELVSAVTSSAINTLASSGRIKIVGVASAEASPVVPGVVPISKLIPGFTSEVMHGVVAPAGTPDEVVRRVNAAFVKVLSDKNIQERFLANSCVAMPGTPAQYAQAIAAEFDQWQAVIRKSGIKME
ncbi:MAG: tripartite tricarboxylate transporter substrate binding protein [Burkholderiales bacterium]|nr:tripartite tricarboxylate transporter substrate binding protein [Burkholderiales bacterium]ODU66392.1 MAG: hypothetical protein ABT05_05460 [Lautropia sp. SCN 66-9]